MLGNRFPLKMKGKVCCCCVRSAILYGNETWCLVRQMDMLGLKETIDHLATGNGVRCYGHVLRKDDNSVLRVALNLEVSGKRK